jgi:hypothetical protein
MGISPYILAAAFCNRDNIIGKENRSEPFIFVLMNDGGEGYIQLVVFFKVILVFDCLFN